MTQAMWIFIILCFLLPAATDLLFHNVSVCWLIGCTVVAMIWNFFCGCEILDLVFCLFPGMIVWLLARFSKGIGMGDIKLFGLMALYTGAFFVYSVLFVSVLLGAIIGIVMLLCFHKGKKTTIPFAPLILIGYIVTSIVGSY